ncbi:TPA: hypothetical protein PXO89_002772 [Yersinia enterocolitica]|nr:hypothetical protein [Yersinia enterocolitica]
MKKLKFNYLLSHVFFFFLGMFATVVILWGLYKDPTRITAPALTALIAMCTFLLALWSAFKVNNWLSNKVNDVAFKKAENILESLTEMKLTTDFIKSRCTILEDINVYSEKDEAWLKDLRENLNKLDEKAFQSYITAWSLIRTLKLFNTGVNEIKVISLLSNIGKCNSKLRLELVEINNTIMNKNYHLTVEASRKYIVLHNQLSNSFTELYELNYDDIFVHNVRPTPPVKKTSS